MKKIADKNRTNEINLFDKNYSLNILNGIFKTLQQQKIMIKAKFVYL